MRPALLALSDILQWAIHGWQLMLLVAVLLGWFKAPEQDAIVRFLRACTEPPLGALRRRLPLLLASGWDLSPLAAYLISDFFLWFLVGGIRELAARA